MKHRNGLGYSRAALLSRLGAALVLAGLLSPLASPSLNAEENRVGLFGSRKDRSPDAAQGQNAPLPIPTYTPEQPGYGPATAGGSALQQFVPTGPPPRLEQPPAPAPRKVKAQPAAPAAPTESAFNPQFGAPSFQPETPRGRPGVMTMPTQTGGQLEQFVPSESETRKFQRQQANAAAEAQQQAMAAQQQAMSRPAPAVVETAAERKQREFYEKYPMPKFDAGAPRYAGPYNPYGPQTAGGNTLQQFVPSGKVKPVQYDAAPAPVQAPSPQELARQAEKERTASSKYYEAKLTMPMPSYEPKPQPGAFYGQGALVTAGGSPLQHYNVPPPANPKVVTNEPAPEIAPSAASLRAQRRAEKAAAEAAAAAAAQSGNPQALPIPTYRETQQAPAGTYHGGPTTASGRPLQPYQPGKKR